MPFRILSLDGGGAWAILEAMALRELFGDIGGRAILSRFDLATANSGGSIVLGALIADKTPSEIVALFKDPARRASLFVPRPWYDRLPNSTLGVGAKYRTAGKRDGIAAVLGALGETPMKDLGPLLPRPAGGEVKLLIFGFDYDWLRAAFFRSYDNAAGSRASAIPLADAINASSTAPVNYFDDPALWGGMRYWDGGVAGYNNPMLAAAVEALIAGTARDEVQILALGTGTVRLAPADHPAQARPEYRVGRKPVSLTNDITKLAEAIVDDPPDAASYIAYITLGNPVHPPPASGSGAIVRLNASVQPVLNAVGSAWQAPSGLDPKDFVALTVTDVDATGPDDVATIERLGRAWIAGGVPNQPIRMGMPDLTCELGDATFAAGAARWKAMTDAPSPPIA